MFTPTSGLPKNATAGPVKQPTFSNGLPPHVALTANTSTSETNACAFYHLQQPCVSLAERTARGEMPINDYLNAMMLGPK